MKRYVLIGLVIAGLAMISLVTSAWRDKPVGVAPSPSASPIEGPSSEPSPDSADAQPDHRDGGQAAADAHEQEARENPILSVLPRVNKEHLWKLELDRVESDLYVIKATVYFVEGQNPEERVAQQRPYIDRFITDTGQTAGYRIELVTEKVID